LAKAKDEEDEKLWAKDKAICSWQRAVGKGIMRKLDH